MKGLAPVNARRVRVLQAGDAGAPGPVLYWMSRDMRVEDNWALLYAQEQALSRQRPLVVAFGLAPAFPFATRRSHDFLLRGLVDVGRRLHALNIAFALEVGEPPQCVAALAQRLDASLVVVDFSPLRHARAWREELTAALRKTPVHECDAHNVVPCWIASTKQETAARTLRPKLWAVASQFLDEFPPVQVHPHGNCGEPPALDVADLLSRVQTDDSVAPVNWVQPGQGAAMERLRSFLGTGLKAYEEYRNVPHRQALSNLSPWLHFGHLSAQRCVMEAKRVKNQKHVEGFLEELLVRRELAENYCFYNAHYDSLQGAAQWARDTLNLHAADARDYVYTRAQLEAGQTHDQLWNAAQLEMVRRGKMHGFMRMYWCKKILEWTASPAEALSIALYLNDKYSLDGRDPNGYVGVMWSICGVHDIGFAERPVFGKIRFMNYDGCKRKFKQSGIDDYVRQVQRLE